MDVVTVGTARIVRHPLTFARECQGSPESLLPSPELGVRIDTFLWTF